MFTKVYDYSEHGTTMMIVSFHSSKCHKKCLITKSTIRPIENESSFTVKINRSNAELSLSLPPAGAQ